MTALRQLQDLIAAKYGIDATALDPRRSMRDAGFDSLALVEFQFEVEAQFGVTLPDHAPDLDSLAALASYIEQVRARHAA